MQKPNHTQGSCLGSSLVSVLFGNEILLLSLCRILTRFSLAEAQCLPEAVVGPTGVPGHVLWKPPACLALFPTPSCCPLSV